MKIGLARRGFSATGGAEKYLHRLIVALEGKGHDCVLFAGPEWPAARRPAGGMIPVAGRTPRAFADRLAALQPRRHCDLLFSMERVWQCDAYRAGDGVHRAWLRRREAAEAPWRRFARGFNLKHRQIVALEESMFAKAGAGRVIANSFLVREEISQWYGYPADRIAVVYNGVPAESLREITAQDRAWSRASLELEEQDFAILFAGTGWIRKGLRHAVAAVGNLPDSARAKLLVAGRGNSQRAMHGQSANASRTRFLGPAAAMHPLYAAADLFVLPTYYDPFSNSCLEALGAGLPVITTRANGFSEIVEQGVDGQVLDRPDDSGAFTAALKTWGDREFRASRRDLRIEKAAAFSIEANVTQTLAALTGPPQADAVGALPG